MLDKEPELTLSIHPRLNRRSEARESGRMAVRLLRMLGRALGYAVMLAFVGAWLIPLGWVIGNAFLSKAVFSGSSGSWEFTLGNFERVWKAAPFGTYYGNTLLVTATIFAVQMVTLTLAAYAFARIPFAGRQAVFMLFLVQIMVPPDVLIFSNYRTLNALGLLDTKLGIMLPYFATSFGVFLLRQAFKQFPHELEEAARIEGSSTLGILFRLYVPLSRPIYLSFAIVSVSYHWNDFLWPLIVTNSPENRLLTVGLAMFAKSSEAGVQWTDVSTAVLIVTAPLLIGFLLFQRQFISSFIHSGVKG